MINASVDAEYAFADAEDAYVCDWEDAFVTAAEEADSKSISWNKRCETIFTNKMLANLPIPTSSC